jgi:hypothetical protein
MLNRLPDRGEDTARSVGSFNKMQEALGRATGYSGNFSDEDGARVTYKPEDIGNTAFAPGAGNIDTGGAGAQGTMGIRRANFSFAAREGDMYN